LLTPVSNPAAFAKRYRYGSLAVLGDDAKYEGYLVTVVDSDGHAVSLQGESHALSIGIGWSREDGHFAVQGGGYLSVEASSAQPPVRSDNDEQSDLAMYWHRSCPSPWL
jgi:hypothetical protein